MLKSLRLKAYAKLNPSLYVGARRFDGFHSLESAAVERLARMAEDEAFSACALGALAQVLCTKEERE